MSRHLSDWLEYYLKFTQNSEPPRLYHLWTGISCITSCLQRKCWLNWGYENLYPNFYIVLVGPPGGRKGTAMKYGKGLLRELKVQLSSDSLGSIQTLYKELMESTGTYRTEDGVILEHRSLSVWSEEFQVFLHNSDQRLIPNLTDLFDSPDVWRYSTLKRGLEDLSKCWLNILGAITPSLLQGNLNREVAGGGLISRMIFVVGYGKRKKVPVTFLSKEEEQLRDHLLADLEQIKQLAGPFRPTAKFIEEYSKWYMSNESTAGVGSEKFIGYNERRATHLRKLCMVMSASKDDDMVLKKEHLDRALYILRHTEREMPNAFYGLGKGAHAQTLAEMLTFINDHKRCNTQEVYSEFLFDASRPELESYLDILQNAGHIKLEKSLSGKTMVERIENVTPDETLPVMKETLYSKLDEE